MNLLSPDPPPCTVRRKSLCNGVLLSINKLSPTPSRKEKCRRGSFSEAQQPTSVVVPSIPPPVRRPSFVQRWFKHISEAADVYKSKNKNEDTSNLTSKNTFETDPNQNTLSSASFSDKQLDDSCVTGHSDDSLVNRFQTKDDEKNNKKFHISDSSDDEDVEQQNARNRITDSSPKNSNSTRTLTQQCSLVAPSEVQISVSPILTAEPVYTPSEQLRRLDDSIRKNLEEKKQIVCDMFRVPTEHFTAITDIAGQPEAPKDPSDLVLAAFAQVQLLTETLNSFMHISTHQHISAVSTPLCDECVTNQQNQLMTLYKRPSPPKGIKHIPSAGELKEITDNHSSIGQQESEDDEYIEIDVDRLPAVLQMDSPSLNSTTKSKTNSQSEQLKRQSTISVDSIPEETEHEIKAEAAIESNTDSRTKNDMKVGSELVSDEVAVGQTPSVVSLIEDQLNSKRPLNEVSHQTTMNGDGLLELCNPNRLMHAASLVPSVPCHLILNYVNNLNQHISSLLPKLNERDLEREKLKKENQHLRELLNSMHSAQRASFEKEASKESRSSEEKDQPGHSQNEQ